MAVLAGTEGLVETPLRRARRWGTLVTSVPRGITRVAGAAPNDRWVWANGAQLVGETCGHIQADEIVCEDLTRDDLDDNWADPVAFQPFLAWVSRACGVLSGLNGALSPAVRRRLAEDLDYQIAHELYSGALTGNPAIRTDPVVITGTALNPHSAIEKLDGVLAANNGNIQATIHVTPGMLTALAHTYVLEREGDSWYTPTGHLVIGDGGYDGAIPNGDNIVDEDGDPNTPGALSTGESYIYATSDVQWDYGDVETFGPTDTLGSAGRSNRFQAIAQAPAIAVFDPNCIHYAILAKLD